MPGAHGLVRSADLVEWLPVRDVARGAAALDRCRRLLRRLLGVWFFGGPGWPALHARRPDLSGPASSGVPTRRAHFAAVFVAIAAAAWILFEPRRLVTSRGDGSLHLTFMDVGQGDATLVRFPRGTTLLVDAGGLSGASSFDIGDRVVGAVLRHYGIRRLDAAAITHGDADHAGGLRVGRSRLPAARRLGGHSRPAIGAAPRSPPRGRGQRRQVDERPGERSVHDRRRRGHRPAPRHCGLGTAGSPQRRFDRAGAPLARRVDRADRRHRTGDRSRASRRSSRPPASASSRCRTTEA